MAIGRAQSARRWGGAGFLLLATAGGGTSCTAPPVPPDPVARQQSLRYAPHFEPAFVALREAVDAHDDELARRILERILARRPDPLTRAHAESFGRILDGRALSRELELFLVPSSVLADPGKVRLELAARHGRGADISFRGGPATLRVLLTGVDTQGSEQRVSRALAVPAAARLDLPAGRTAALDLGEFEVSGARNLALQADWQLELRAGSLALSGREYPANDLTVRQAVTQRLATWLPDAPIPPESLAEYVAGGGRAVPALMERAVRVGLDEREAALDALTAPALALTQVELERLVPALRWLSGRRELGADALAWQRWLAQRAGERGRPAATPGAPDLPQTPARADARVLPERGADDGAARR